MATGSRIKRFCSLRYLPLLRLPMNRRKSLWWVRETLADSLEDTYIRARSLSLQLGSSVFQDRAQIQKERRDRGVKRRETQFHDYDPDE